MACSDKGFSNIAKKGKLEHPIILIFFRPQVTGSVTNLQGHAKHILDAVTSEVLSIFRLPPSVHVVSEITGRQSAREDLE